MHSGNGTLSFPYDRVINFSDKDLDIWIEQVRSMIVRTDDREKEISLEIELCYLQRETYNRIKTMPRERKVVRPRFNRHI